ncbi:DUF3021 domain-containing protein [Streptococcus sp. X16XC17]|uniref:DUF3021 domain-containing protein n=1 Tax=unclassified Streptococcus TaxID=2608887 RepID=UPI00066FC318|nr:MULTISPECIES: DUF3021 domain-containing protein [unclassified Streptococcus]TCD45428.1 DUF3021 domain-containing protein [Streptococcus sp. X16XC17]
MKKYIRSAATGIAVGTIISIIMSALFSGKTYMPMNPFSTIRAYYVAHFSQVQIMMILVLIWASIGILFEAADLIFSQDWSLLRQTVVHFLVTAFGFTPLAILAGWFPLSVGHLLSFLIEFTLIYAVVYALQFFQMRRNIEEINQRTDK